MIRRGDMLDTSDVIDVLAIDLLGIVPEDEAIIVSTNRGVPIVMENNSLAGRAFRNIAGRLLGEEIPFVDMEAESSPSLLRQIGRFVRRN